MERSIVNLTGCIRLKIKLVEKEKERNAWRRVVVKKLTVAEQLNDIPRITAMQLCILRFTTGHVIHREV
jgi:hypothetical protein